MRPKRDTSYGIAKALLLLGRVSNLPTVWSNCLAAWLLAGGALGGPEDQLRFAWLIAGAPLLYLAGMFLNDAFDERFDREHRAERPIPRGVISARTVWVLGVLQMALSLGCVISINLAAAVCALGLAACVLWYNWQHKRINWSPLIMGLCRLLLYLLAAAVAVGWVAWPVVLGAVVLGGYIVGLSNIAREEATRGRVNSWPCWLLLLPLAIPSVLISIPTLPEREAWILLLPLIVFALWVGRSLLFTFKAAIPQHVRTVSGLLAGIVLLDAVVASVPNPGFAPVFMVLFLLALLFQRFIPAT